MEIEATVQKLSPVKGDLLVIQYVEEPEREDMVALCQLLAQLKLDCHFMVLPPGTTVYHASDNQLRQLGLVKFTDSIPC